MLLLRNINCVSIVQLNFSFSFFNVFYFIIQKVTYLMTTENEKKKLKLTKNIIYVASSNIHSLGTGLWSVLFFVFNCTDLTTPSFP